MNPNLNPNQPPGPNEPAGTAPSGSPPNVGRDPRALPPGIYPTPAGSQAPLTPAQPAGPNPIATPVPPSPPPTPELKRSRIREGWRSVAGTVMLLVLAPAIALTLTAFAFQSYQVDGASMETTLQNNDRLIVNKIPRTISRITDHPYVPKRGDIIIFNQGGVSNATGGQQKQLIKRVVGLPGDRVVITSGQLTIYNTAHPDGFNPDNDGTYTISAKTTPGDDVNLAVNEGQVFVLGDNRANSEDSRYFGPVNVDKIVGKLSLRVVPLDKIQKF